MYQQGNRCKFRLQQMIYPLGSLYNRLHRLKLAGMIFLQHTYYNVPIHDENRYQLYNSGNSDHRNRYCPGMFLRYIQRIFPLDDSQCKPESKTECIVSDTF